MKKQTLKSVYSQIEKFDYEFIVFAGRLKSLKGEATKLQKARAFLIQLQIHQYLLAQRELFKRNIKHGQSKSFKSEADVIMASLGLITVRDVHELLKLHGNRKCKINSFLFSKVKENLLPLSLQLESEFSQTA